MLFRLLILPVLLTAAFPVSAIELKKFNLGAGYYSLQLYDEADTYDSDRFNGISLSASYAFSDNIALQATYYELRKGDFAYSDANGRDVFLYAGNGLATPGGKWYVGAGYFNEQWHASSASNTFNGFQLGGGFGYNGEIIALDLRLSFRDTDDYDNTLGTQSTRIVTAGVLNLVLSARF